MATKYWVALQGTATVPTANTASNWNTAADGSGTSGVPGTTDDCIFGHQDSIDAQLGFAACDWDLSQVDSITVEEGYLYQTAETSDDIEFKSSTREIIHHTKNFETLGFKQGMWITVTGSTLNNGSYHISAITANKITTSTALVDESVGPSVTIVSESSIDFSASTCTLNSLSLDGTIKNTSGSNKTIRFEGTPGTNNWYITNGPNAQVLNQDDLTYNFNSAQTISFDDGPYPKVTVTAAADLEWDYKAAPTSPVHGAVSFYSLNVSDSSATATGTLNDPRNDFKKVFKVLTTAGFGFSPSRFDAGFSTWHFKPDASFSIPVTGSLLYGAADGSFTAAWYNLVLDEPDTAGEICTVDAGRTLNLNSLTVESGVQMQGYTVKGAGLTSTVVCINRPTINGAWNFSQVAEGIYSSIVTDTHPFTPSHGAAGRIQFSDYGGKFFSDPKLTWTTSSSTLTVDGKLTVTGLIDPTGLVLSEVGTDPASTGAGEGTIWVKSTTPTTLYFTDSAGSDHQLGTGGGGGGAVSSVFGRTGAVVATEGDYDLDELGDVAITSAELGDILVHNGTRFINHTLDTILIKIKAREAISKGEAVYCFDGEDSHIFGAKLAKADSASTMPAVGIAYQDLSVGDVGLCIMIGRATGVNANFTEGDVLYVSPTTAGALTNTKPTGNTHLIQNVGILMKAHASNASVKVTGVGRTNDVPNQFSVGGSITAGSFVKSGGTSSEFLKADGSVDTNTYITTAYTDADAIAAVEGESTLTLSSGVTVGTDLKMTTSSDNAIIENVTQDKDIIFKVNDGGSSTEVMRIDGSKSYVTIGGVSSASAMLHLQSSTSAQPEVRLENTNSDAQEATIRFMKNTASPASGDDIGLIRFEGENSAGSNHLYGYIMAQMLDPTDTQEAGEIIFYIGHKGAQRRVLEITGSNTGTGEITINEGGSGDFNFRVESDNEQHMLFVDSADDRVGIGTSSPASTLHVDGTVRQTNATSAVLVADSNGDLTAASNLQDAVYVQSGQGGSEPFNIMPPGAPTDWAGAPPATIDEAISRLAAWAQTAIPGPIP